MHAPASPARQPTRGEILLLGCLIGFGAVTIDLYLPALPDIGRAFGASAAAVQLTLSVFFVGMALGQLVHGPASDRLGRRPVVLAGCGLYVVASLVCAAAPSLDWLIVGRFGQALGCCAAMVVARAVVRDRYDHADSARIFSLLTLVLGVAPLLAPTLGGWLAAMLGWRWVFGGLALFGAGVALTVWARLDESRSDATAVKARSTSVLAGYRDLLSHRRLVGYVLVAACNGATLFAYIAAASDLIITVWGFTPGEFGLVFAGIAVGVIGSSQVNRVVLRRASPDAILAVAGPLSLLSGLLLLALALADAGPWPLLAGLFLVLTGNGFIAANALAGALAVDPLRAGASAGLFGAANFGCGALASALAAAFHDGTAVPMAVVMAVALAIAALAFRYLARPPVRP